MTRADLLEGLRAVLVATALAACQPDGDAPAGKDAGQPISTPHLEVPGSVTDSPTTRPAPHHAEHGGRKAVFDYWVLALSWSPEFCVSSEARPDSRQCSESREFIVHGLWPQYERGYPASCDTHTRVDDSTADRLEALVPDRGLVFHQWKKHGSCSGMAPAAYFDTMERAARAITIPSDYLARAAHKPVGRQDLEHAFIEVNPGLTPEAITFDCKGAFLREVRVCLDLDLKPRGCGADLREACSRSVSVRSPGG